MNRILVCYEIEGKIFVDAKSDFKEIRFNHGIDKVKVIKEKFCHNKRQEIDFTKDCLNKAKIK